MADMYGMYNQPVNIRYSEAIKLLLELKDRIAKIMQQENALSLKDLAVNGKDLIAAGIPAGKEMGRILKELMDCVIEDPSMNTKEKLLEVAEKIR